MVLASSFSCAQSTNRTNPGSSNANDLPTQLKKVNLMLVFTLDNSTHSVAPGLNVSIFNVRTSYQSFLTTNESGETMFEGLLPGEYTVQVKDEIKNDIQNFHINVISNGARYVEYLKIAPKESPNGALGTASISAAELAVPEKAKSEQAKGIKDFQKNKNIKAKGHFLAALKYCPVYASAMNDMGVLAIRENSMTEAERWFRQAIEAVASVPRAKNPSKRAITRHRVACRR